MRAVSMTGGDGFLGWHVQCALMESSTRCTDVPVGRFFDPVQARSAIDGSERLIHLAGVNRGTDDEVREGNIEFAQQIADVIAACDAPPKTIVYSNSIQASLGNVYGDAKARAAQILAEAASRVGAEFVDVRFPNLFGEHGRPFYNSVTATFCHMLASGGTPEIHQDRELTLLHAQNAADVLIGAVAPADMQGLEVQATVTQLLARLQRISVTYARGEIPDISSAFDRDLFNTYRSFTLDTRVEIPLVFHADPRGAFCEIMRSGGGQSQVSFSTTVPGVTRGNHFHRRKIERFVVIAGSGVISLRRCGTDTRLDLPVNGDSPVAIDMPTMWAHNITNTGLGPMYTAFWIDTLYDPSCPDTIPEVV